MPPYQLFYAIFSGSFSLALFQLCPFRDPLFICSPLTDLLSNLSTLFSVLIYSIVRENDYQRSAIFKRRSQRIPCVSVDTRV